MKQGVQYQTRRSKEGFSEKLRCKMRSKDECELAKKSEEEKGVEG